MARRRTSRRGGSGGMNKWLKIGAFATIGAILAPKVGLSPAIGGAAGGYMAGKNLVGAGAGYVAGPMIASKVSGLTGATTGGDIFL